MSQFTQEYKIKCWNDCRMEGCPGHSIKIEANNTSNALLYTKDGDIKFGMDFDELIEFVISVHKMRGWVEIDSLFKELEAMK
jgi:hypothetical protein